MKAEELRIGNLILTTKDSNKDYVTTKVSGAIIDYVECEIILATPIRLTEEWLQKLGFDKVRNCYLVRNGFEAGLDGNDFTSGTWTIIIAKKLPVKIKYVHQLQNLYFALTGEELTLNQES